MTYSWLFFTLSLFCVSLYGIILYYNNLIITLIMMEVLLFSIILNFIFFSISSYTLYGYFYAFLLLGIAAAETTIGLTLVICYFKVGRYRDLTVLNLSCISL